MDGFIRCGFRPVRGIATALDFTLFARRRLIPAPRLRYLRGVRDAPGRRVGKQKSGHICHGGGAGARRVEGLSEFPKTGEFQRDAQKLNEFKPLDEG